MPTSDTTLLVAVNEILRNVGERGVLNLDSPISKKARDSIRQALGDIDTAFDWSYLRSYIPAISWTEETADLGTIQRVLGVSYGSSSVGYRTVSFVDIQTFDHYPLIAFTSTPESYPLRWTYHNYNLVKLNPYPNDSVTRAKVRFYVVNSTPMPALPSDVFQLPERYIPLLTIRATGILATNHLNDAVLAQSYFGTYQSKLQTIQSRERSRPAGGQNMYKRLNNGA